MTDEGDDPQLIWARIDPTVIVPQPSVVSNQPDVTEKQERFGWRAKLFLTLWTVLAILIWIYCLLKIFVFDIDRWLVDRIAPGASEVLAFRFFIVLALIALFGLAAKSSWLGLLYVVFFPLIVLLVGIPALFYVTRSWTLFFGLLHVVSTMFRRARHKFAATVLLVLACLAVSVSDGESPIVFGSAVLLAVGIAAEYVRAFILTLKPSRFIQQQIDLIKGVVKANWTWKLVGLDDTLKSAEIQRYTAGQLQQISNSVGFGLTLHRAMYLWANKLKVYGSSGTIMLLSVASYLWLYVKTVLLFSFLNLAVYRLRPDEFQAESSPSFLVWVYYSMSSLALNSITAVDPLGGWALGVKVVAGVLGPVLLLTLVAGVLLSIRRERQKEQLDQAIETLRAQGRVVKERFASDFGLSPREAAARLEQLGLSIGLSLFRGSLPDDYDDE